MRFHSKADLFALAPQRDTPEGPAYLEIPVLPYGTYEHQQYGTLVWDDPKFDAMIANFDAQVTGWAPSLGSDHAFYNPFAAEAPAYGWPVALYKKPGEGLFSRVDLNPRGEKAIEDKEYRYISAEVANKWKTSSGDEFENVIEGMTLTNRPWHDTMPGLFDGRMRELLLSRRKPDPKLCETFSAALLARVPGSLSFDEIECQLRLLLRAEAIAASDDPYGYGALGCDYDDLPWVVEVYPVFCIYRVGWSGPHYKRSYTVDGETVTLGSDTVEVEQVWVEATRAAMQAAMQAVKKMSARKGGSDPADAGQRGTRMALDWRKFLQRFGVGSDLKADATDEEYAAEFARQMSKPTAGISGDPTKVPPADPKEFVQAEGDTLTLSAAEVTTLRAKAARADEADAAKATAEAALARKAAEEMIGKQMATGKIIPAQFGGKALDELPADHPLMQFALTNPAGFVATFDSAKPQLDLTPGRGGLQPKGGHDGEGSGEPKTFMALVGSYVGEEKLEYSEAFARAAEERPDLYDDYRKQSTAAGRDK